MNKKFNVIWRVLASLLMLLGLAAPAFPARAAASDPIHANSEIAITLDGTRDAGYIKIAEDLPGDLSSTGPGGWIGTHWTDLTALYVAADASNLYVYVDLPAYYSGSDGQIGLIIETDSQPNSGGSTDPWGNDIDFTFTSINSFTSALPLLPDYVIRGDISTKGGWTELRTWNGADWNTGASANWGGISGGALIGTHVAYSYNQGVEFSIPLTDIGSPNPADIKLQFFGTQEGETKGAFDTLMNDDQTVGWDDATTLSKLVSVPLAVDPDGDLASPGPGDAPLAAWTDMTAMHVWASHNTLYAFFPMPDYDEDLSEGQIGLTIDTQPGGGSTDPWGNAITWAYTTTEQNLGSTPVLTTTTLLPDYIIRGNIFGSGGNGWTELRTWNGANFNTGNSIDWGGIGGGGQPSQPGSKVAWSNNDGLRLAIPFADISVSAGDEINLQFLGTQGGASKGAYDTLPSDDQSLNWDDPTTQKVYATYQIPFVDAPIASHDNSVWWAELGHNSRDPLYRTPGGPVSTGTAVTLRLRAAAGDLTAAQVRVWNDRLDADTTYDLALASSDTQYDWWEVTLPASPDSTIYWYRFIAIDGSDTDYYEDDSGRTGGWGQAFDESPDNSWQLTIYKDGYTTPDWVKNAIFYQIFPDRFRDGDLDNHTPAGTAFYDEPDTVFRSNQANWNQPICNPRDAAGPCPGAYSQNFYGGDLQGILDQLDYIEELGITAIYLNPIFESPSNHKYDASDYSVIDDNFGDLALFESLVQGANDRGIRVILDGVFNHTSSDSLYFDRYHRYASDGACESHTSPYRDWYYFTDVTPGTGSCVSSTGVANGANYESWWGYDSLPKLDSTKPAVRALIYSGPGDPIAMYWVRKDEDHPRADGWRLDVGADVDPGTTNDPTNLYWDEFRTAVHSANPEGYIVGEEWSYGTAWLIGDEWDAVMNYKFSTAVLGFWREGSFTDNDHNTGSSAGPINELTPSELNERLLDLQERYPAEALYAMLNLLDSHDTNRALFMLDSRTGENDASIYLKPDYNWSDAIVRLRGTAILQLTLPGAPTIYYGDEVGLVGPTIYAGGKWEDDPYNRQPFPWLDLVGDEPFYNHLTTQAGQDAIRDHYILLTTARNNHPALRTGSFDPLLVDDTDLVYAYGRKLIDTATPANSDAAVVILNRDTAAHTFTYDLSSYLPAGTVLTDVLATVAPYTYTVQVDGSLSPALNVSPMFGAVLVLASGSLNPPAAPLNLLAVEGISQVDLAWDASADAASYNLYRSPLSGGGYTLITNTTALTYTDIDVVNSTWYYYVVTAVGTNGMQSDYSNEAAAMPHYAVDDAFIQWPPAITHTIGLTPTENITGSAFITDTSGLTPGLLAQVGFGPTTTHPLNWTWWSDAAYNVDNGGYDEFAGSLTPEYTGDFGYVYRFSTTRGRDWVYADLNGIFTDTLTNPGLLFVNPSTDIIAPTAPLSLTLSDWDSSYLELTWQPATDETSLYAYDVFRSEISGTLGTHVGRVTAPATVFTDTGVTTNLTYYYVVQALDTSFNRSDYSNEVEGTPKPKVVQVTFNVGVPDDTPGTVYIVGDHPALATWTPGALPMTYNITDSVWTRTVELPDKQPIQFKFTRGSWERVEWWGSIVDMANRHAVVDYGTDGTQVIDLTATDWGIGDDDTKAVQYWRDPYVIDFAPADLAVMVPNDTTIWAAWGKPMTDTTTFEVEGPGGPITGTFGYDDLTRPTTVFTPSLILPPGIYTVTVIDQISADGQSQQIPATWQFMVGPLPTVQLTGAAYSAAEVDGAAVVTATLNTPSLASVTVDYATANGTALAGDDYT
ncbi:MAG TPA: alpha-amylase family glycosyl hydrolase, partial [Anaerolineales bacterium]|nr:alpha-amylase family glycosyl hydrolase [Anaerolineales bacterium]